MQLLGEIGRRLIAQRRKGGAPAPAVDTVTLRAGEQAPTGIAGVVKPGNRASDRRAVLPLQRSHRRVVIRYRTALERSELFGDVLHLRVAAPAVGEGDQLSLEISAIEARETRGSCAIALSTQAVARDARAGGPRPRPAQRDQLAGRRQRVPRSRRDGRAGGQRGGGSGKTAWMQNAHLRFGNRGGAGPVPKPYAREGQRGSLIKLAILLAFVLSLAACKPPPDDRTAMPLASAERGEQAIARAGCGSCHTIAGIDWPRGKTASELRHFQNRGLIAGKLPNRPDVLAAFIRDAPALVPGIAMPAMPVTEQEARDIAKFLYRGGA